MRYHVLNQHNRLTRAHTRTRAGGKPDEGLEELLGRDLDPRRVPEEGQLLHRHEALPQDSRSSAL